MTPGRGKWMINLNPCIKNKSSMLTVGKWIQIQDLFQILFKMKTIIFFSEILIGK